MVYVLVLCAGRFYVVSVYLSVVSVNVFVNLKKFLIFRICSFEFYLFQQKHEFQCPWIPHSHHVYQMIILR